jgi:SAM-dependent methyltransferase
MTTSPYREFSQYYDRVIGDAVAPTIKRNIEQSRRHYGISFDSAADIGCGTGQLLRYLSRRCAVVYGVDSSPEMLRQARRRTGDKNIQFLHQDLRELQLPRPVDVITCTFDTLNYLTTPDHLKRAFRRIRDNLREGGHVIFDMITGAGESGRRLVRQRVRLPEATGVWLVAIDGRRRQSRVEMRWRSRGDDGRPRLRQEVHLQRWYPLALLCAVLSQCGLAVRGIHDAASYQPASRRTWWALFVAYKPPLNEWA